MLRTFEGPTGYPQTRPQPVTPQTPRHTPTTPLHASLGRYGVMLDEGSGKIAAAPVVVGPTALFWRAQVCLITYNYPLKRVLVYTKTQAGQPLACTLVNPRQLFHRVPIFAPRLPLLISLQDPQHSKLRYVRDNPTGLLLGCALGHHYWVAQVSDQHN